MKRFAILITTIIAAFAMAACSTAPTGDTDTDAGAAANYLPTGDVFDNYTVTEADSITDAITAAAGDGAEALDNAAVSAAVTAVDSFIECYNDVGAVSARIYTQTNLGDILSGDSLVPSVGTIAVVNQDRVQENFLACAAESASGNFSAQSAPTVCRGSGSFSAADDAFRYIYISTSDAFCEAAVSHFEGIS